MLDSGLTEQDMVSQEFEELYPGKIQRTQIVYNAKVNSGSCVSQLAAAEIHQSRLCACFLSLVRCCQLASQMHPQCCSNSMCLQLMNRSCPSTYFCTQYLKHVRVNTCLPQL